MEVLDDGRIVCRVRISGSYQGRPFTYTDPPESKGSQYIWKDGDPSRYWWTEGNFGCDCNRSRFLPEDWNVPESCGEEILINKIEPIDHDGPVLELNEEQERESTEKLIEKFKSVHFQ